MRTLFTVSAITLLTSLSLSIGHGRVLTIYADNEETPVESSVNHPSINNWSDELRSLSVAEPSLYTNERIAELTPVVPKMYKETFDRIARVLRDRYTAQTLNIRY